MANQDEEGVAYTDHSGDEQRQYQQPEQQQEALDLNATVNDATGTNGTNVNLEDLQNRRPPTPVAERSRNQSAFHRLGPGDPTPKPFGGIGTDESCITQELRHRIVSMEHVVQELQRENAKL
ncbi:hypothetical protein PIB30_028096 [Stylosanthes scabra]|uniref:Uncharacterized protein n=1 Tax=Stylosanthes scabra TaxID=79078 RepID=A0ABU6TB17_9FABA|nr:hypothetical protein [Stylosanthes scabra]